MTVNKPLFTFIAIAALSLLSAGSVMAQEFTPDQARALVAPSLASRADVLAQAAAFRASGERSPWSRDFQQTVVNPQPRAVVKAETLRAIRNHEVVNAGEFYSIAVPQTLRLAGNSH